MKSKSNHPTYAKAFTCIYSYHIFYSASEMWDQCDSVLLHSTLLAILLCLGSYKQCCIQLLKKLHKCCNMDMLEDLLIYSHSPSGAVHLRNHAYISVTSPAAMLQYINVAMYVTSFVVCISLFSLKFTCLMKEQILNSYIIHKKTRYNKYVCNGYLLLVM